MHSIFNIYATNKQKQDKKKNTKTKTKTKQKTKIKTSKITQNKKVTRV